MAVIEIKRLGKTISADFPIIEEVAKRLDTDITIANRVIGNALEFGKFDRFGFTSVLLGPEGYELSYAIREIDQAQLEFAQALTEFDDN
jgi:hypothetical protein